MFAPLLLRAQDESMTGLITDALPTQRVVRALIENFDVLFKVRTAHFGYISRS